MSHQMSESIKNLATALSKMQALIRGAIKDSSNPFFKSSYADLESVWDAIREPLVTNGLAISQTTGTDESGKFCLITTLMHTSGEWIQGSYPLIAKDNTPQSLGSATSYARRYALAAIVGLYQTDDDGHAATHGHSKQEAPKKSSQIQPPAPLAEPGVPYHDAVEKGEKPRVSMPQLTRLFAIAKEFNWAEPHLRDQLYKRYGIQSTKDLDLKDYDDLISYIQKNPQPYSPPKINKGNKPNESSAQKESPKSAGPNR